MRNSETNTQTTKYLNLKHMGRFKPGDEIVCIDNLPRHYPTCSLELHKVYTVTGVIGRPRNSVILAEDKSPNNQFGDYYEDRFAPLVSDAILEKELESVPEPFTV